MNEPSTPATKRDVVAMSEPHGPQQVKSEMVADFFMSYSRQDETWVHGLANALGDGQHPDEDRHDTGDAEDRRGR